MRIAKLFGWTALMVTALVMVETSTAAEKGAPLWHRDVSKAWEATQLGTRPMLLFVTMDGCTYCVKMKHETYANEGVKTAIKKSFVAASAAAETNRTLVRRFKIESYPTTIIFAPDGKMLDSIVGYIGPKQMQRRLKAAALYRKSTHQPVSSKKKKKKKKK